MTIRLTLVLRAYCHLCDEMRAGVLRLTSGRDVVLEEVDVDASEALEARWSELVPVLLCGSVATGVEVCHHFLDGPRLLGVLAGGSDPSRSEAGPAA